MGVFGRAHGCLREGSFTFIIVWVGVEGGGGARFEIGEVSLALYRIVLTRFIITIQKDSL